MILRGTEYGPIFDASGVEGFFREGYRHHRLLHLVPGFNLDGVTFVTKTTTFEPRQGNATLQSDGIIQRDFMPDCIVAKPIQGVMLNAVGLSGPGVLRLLQTSRWQERTKPFMISFMATGDTVEQRLVELQNFILALQHAAHEFKFLPALQINFSCPNVGLNLDDLPDEVAASLKIAAELGVPLVPKFNILMPTELALEIGNLERCDAICVSNTIPWGKLPELIDWKGLFGSDISPLAKYGGGGLSGKPLLPLVSGWVQDVRRAGFKKPIMAGGGILSPKDVIDLHRAGASAVFIGSVVNLRPWRVKAIIKMAYRVFNC